MGQRYGDPGVDRRGRAWRDGKETKQSTKHGQAWDKAEAGLCKNEWMAATQGKCHPEAEGPPLPLRYALDPHPAAPQCPSANHVSHTLGLFMPPILGARVGTSGAALVVRKSALQLRKQWLSRNLCDGFCPALSPVSLSSLLAHCDGSMAAIFGAPAESILHQRALHALQQLSPQSDLYSNLILGCACLTVFVLPAS